MATEKVPVSLRISPEVKARAEARAAEQNRSFASYVEWLIIQDAASAPAQPTAPAGRTGR